MLKENNLQKKGNTYENLWRLFDSCSDSNRKLGKWGITQGRVPICCKEGRFAGAVLKGRIWIAPGNVEKPDDLRRNRKKDK